MDFDATLVPQDIVADLGLQAGKKYAGQNVSTTATLFTRPATSVVNTGDRAFRAEAGGTFVLDVKSGQSLWMWTDDAGGCPVIVNEVP